jgi:cellulose synthase/poly-beta-1,6-N-acetylglucosamine synthase-like glycosyltransferase
MLSVVIIGAVCLPAFLTIVWFAEILAGCFELSRKRPSATAAGRERSFKTAVLIPAHNEGAGVLPTIRDALDQLGPNDRVLVVADNCTDNTAEIARAAGVDVIVRNDPQRRGKGYALEFGVRHMAIDPPDVVVILDADCRLDGDALARLSESAMSSGRPVQSTYLMLAPEGVSPGGVSLFAWRVKNWLRPLGMKALGLPTQLVGTGMAFPFPLLAGRDLGNCRLAEDTALGLALAAAGHPPLFLSEARIHSTFPVSQAGAVKQRQRWEKGHLDNIVDLVPGAIATSLRDRNLALAALAVDMAVPPLSLLALITIVCVGLGGIAFVLSEPPMTAALAIPVFSALLLALGTLLAWIAVGRDVLSVRGLLMLPLRVIGKLVFYQKIASGKASSTWIRTDRK